MLQGFVLIKKVQHKTYEVTRAPDWLTIIDPIFGGSQEAQGLEKELVGTQIEAAATPQPPEEIELTEVAMQVPIRHIFIQCIYTRRE